MQNSRGGNRLTELEKKQKILITGAAGLVGQNLVIQLKENGYNNLTCLDKHAPNLKILASLHSDISCHEVDLFDDKDNWANLFENVDIVIMLHAQIGAPTYSPFSRNNIEATKNVLSVLKQHDIKKLVHISSSVVNSVADDFYTQSKREQERLVVSSEIPHTILRPTLMFGWFDRKHLGWLSRFMEKTPFFPIPGNGKFMRQPLYERDFCNVICSSLSMPFEGKSYNISGGEEVDYIDIIKKIKVEKNLKTIVFKLPFPVFYIILKIFENILKNPPFTTQQLRALIAGDKFEVIPWWDIFNVRPTKFNEAIKETFSDDRYSKISLKF